MNDHSTLIKLTARAGVSVVHGRSEHEPDALHECLELLFHDIVLLFAAVELLEQLVLLQLGGRGEAGLLCDVVQYLIIIKCVLARNTLYLFYSRRLRWLTSP